MHPIDLALKIATQAHAGQLDRSGHPVILHPLAVGLMGHTDEEKAAGFLHDVVEDTNVSIDQLFESGLPPAIVNAVEILTRKPDTDYFDYVQQIIDSQNHLALQVKLNDLTHNSQREGEGSAEKAKHSRALQMVSQAIQNLAPGLPRAKRF